MSLNNSDIVDQLFLKISLKDDEEAFQRLFFEFFSSLCVFSHRYINDWTVCEDIVQEAFFKIWKNRKSIDIASSSRNFLVTTVRNLCVDYLRKEDVARTWQEKEGTKDYESTSENLYSLVELEQILSDALSKLPENIRTVFELNRFEGKTYKEIAEENEISIKTVESYMSKALKLLRTELKDYLPLLILFFW